jgi:ribosomal protein S18 acetylase RimI-like enzyme
MHRFRNATDRDLADVMSLEYEAFDYGIRENEGTFRRRLEVFSDGVIVVENESRHLIGYLTSEIWQFRPQPTLQSFDLGHDIALRHNPRGTELYISSMTIAPRHRGHGLGRELFNHSLAVIKQTYSQLTSCILLVNEQWQHARKIYVSEGFAEILVLEKFFRPAQGSPTNGIVMRRAL